MVKNALTRMGRWVVALMLLCTPLLVTAEDGRDFAGFYSVSDVVSGTQVTLRFSLDVSNYSGADVADATVRLDDPNQAGFSFFMFPIVSIPYRDLVRVSAYVTIPQSEYDSWEQSALPTLGISFFDVGGNLVERPIEVARLQLSPEGN